MYFHCGNDGAFLLFLQIVYTRHTEKIATLLRLLAFIGETSIKNKIVFDNPTLNIMINNNEMPKLSLLYENLPLR